MKPVDQTRFGGPLDPPETRGNCMEACVASIFELSLDDVPALEGDDWAAPLRRWLQARGLDCVTVGRPDDGKGFGAFDLDAWGVLAVPSRFHRMSTGEPALHAVVWRAGKVEHDPSSRSRALGPWDAADGVTLDLFVALDPAVVVRQGSEIADLQPDDEDDEDDLDDEAFAAMRATEGDA